MRIVMDLTGMEWLLLRVLVANAKSAPLLALVDDGMALPPEQIRASMLTLIDKIGSLEMWGSFE